MKRILEILSLFVLLLFTAGCVHENYDECPPKTGIYNVSIEFSLRDGEGNDVFGSDISTVELGIYDDNGTLIMTKHISRAELNKFQGIKLTLDPGLYHIAGWGNIGENTKYTGVDVPYSYGAYVTYTKIISNKVTDADKAYYAPKNEDRSLKSIVVDPVAGYAGVLEFTPAHRTVKVYIEGYSGTPKVELLNLPEGLQWIGMKWLTDTYGSKRILSASKTTIPVEQNNVQYDYAAFDTFHFDADNEIILNITDNSTQETAFSVTLNEIFEETGFPAGITISVMVRFTPAGVEVDIPEWETHEVDPDLG